MDDLIGYAVEAAQGAGAEHAEARIVSAREEYVETKNGAVAHMGRDETIGVGIRVLVEGAWGFASFGGELTRKTIEATAKQAVNVARASHRVSLSPVRLVAEPSHVDTWQTPIRVDPFGVPLSQKVDLAVRCDEAMMRPKGITVVKTRILSLNEHIWFASSEGSRIEQTLFTCGGGLEATAANSDDVQRRSYPQHWGQYMSAGYEVIEGMKLLEHAEQTASEAVELLMADECPVRRCDVIVEGSQLALQIHESVGHPVELDRVLGLEANFAGTSFATIEKLNKLQYGAPMVNIVANGSARGGLATRGYDDEGVATQQWHIIQDGVLAGYLMSRETAAMIGMARSNGAVRADGYANVPMIRMTNISLMPDTGTLDELIADTKDGVYVDTNRSWSIDQRRVNFQFGTEAAWEIKDGRKTRLLKNATYSGRTTEFWNACTAICGPEEFVLWGVLNCGKGEPCQTARMSHGAAPARFAKVKVGEATRE